MKLGQILLNFFKLHRMVHHIRVILPVDDALLKRRECFCPSHGDRVGSPSLKSGDKNFVVGNSKLNIFEIREAGHRLFRICEMAEVRITVPKDTQATRFHRHCIEIVEQLTCSRLDDGFFGIKQVR